MIESEKLLEKKLALGVKRMKGWSFKLWPVSVTGLPDRICLLPGGRLFFAEIKTTGEKTRPIQDIIIKKIKDLGFRVEIIDTSEQIKNILSEYERK